MDFDKVRTYPFARRRNLVRVEDFRRPPAEPAARVPFLETLPDVLAARDLRQLAAAVRSARAARKGVVFALGGHVVKTGAAVHLIPLVEEGYLTALAVNGAFLIHDYEIGRFGATSEDVAASLPDGEFGLTEETGRELNAFATEAARTGAPVAELAGRALNESGPHAAWSLLAAAARAGIAVTVHVALGADVIHQHPRADGAAWGRATFDDFRRFAAGLKTLDGGGVYVNLGSAVVLPEVFVKALNLARHLEPPVTGFTAANLDMIQHYRPRQNVLARPTLAGGTALALTGHHEIMVPLLVAAIRAGA